MDELQELFGELRAQLATPPSHEAWRELCAIIEIAAELAPAQVQAQWLPYLERAVQHWPSPLRAYYLPPLEDALLPAQALAMSLCHHLYLSEHKLTTTLEQLEHLDTLPKSILALHTMRPLDEAFEDGQRIKRLETKLQVTIHPYDLTSHEWKVYCQHPAYREQLLDPQQRRRALLIATQDSGAELLMPPHELIALLKRAQLHQHEPTDELADTLYLRALIEQLRAPDTSLRLLHTHQDDAVIEALIQMDCLAEVTSLDLGVSFHTADHQPSMRALGQLVSACAPRLHVLNLSHHQLTDMHVEAIHAAIQDQRLYTLDLAGCTSTLAQAEALLNAPGISGLRELHLNPAMLFDEPSNSSRMLFELIARSEHIRSLEHLTLRSWCNGGFHHTLDSLPHLKSFAWVSYHTSHPFVGRLVALDHYHVVTTKFAGTLKRYVTPDQD